MEIDSRLFPLSLYGTFRQVLQGGDFSERKSTEEFHVDQLSQLRLDFRQLIQCIADRREFFSVNRILAWVGFERSNFEFTPALDCVAAPGVINDQSAHHTCGITHEPRPVGKAVAFARGDVEIGLVQKCRNAEACWGSPSCQFPFCQSVQFRVQSAEQCIRGRAIAAFSRANERGNRRPHAALSCLRMALNRLSLAHLPVTTNVFSSSTTSNNIC